MIDGNNQPVPDFLRVGFEDALVNHKVKAQDEARKLCWHWGDSVTFFEREACEAALRSTNAGLFNDEIYKHCDSRDIKIRICLELLAERIKDAIRIVRELHAAVNSLRQERRIGNVIREQEDVLAAMRETSADENSRQEKGDKFVISLSKDVRDHMLMFGRANADFLWKHNGMQFTFLKFSAPISRPQHREVRALSLEYLDRPWLHCPTLDWLFTDLLMYIGIDAMSIRFADASEYTMPRRNSGIYNRSRTDHYDDSQIDVAWLNRQIMHVTRMVSALAVASIVIATAVAYSLFSSNSILAICIGLVAAYCLPLYGKQAFESFKVVLKSHSESICRATVVYDQLGAHLARICPVALRDQCISITPVGAEWPPELFVLLGAIAKRGGPSFIHSPSIYTK